ncbi:zinc ABC transporter substrate-binding protein ZnuA [Vibrio sp. WXL210]|uniref:zinc ABC transporter substrate-binding protein ZnuA n=1 Tax=Vibrio sp. WXL210 TaxID=3450709 RepID=UPI003EC68C1F
MIKHITLLLLIAFSLSAPARAIDIVTSIKPIQMITLELTQGVTEPGVVMNSTASPHDYAMRPSDAKKIRDADVIIWFGPELEAFMSRMVADDDRVITIGELEGVEFREFADMHAHDGHDHGSVDPHFWLGISQTDIIAQAIAKQLAKLDPNNEQKYLDNYQNFSSQLQTVKQEIATTLSPVREHGYFVFHDAYGYFEDEFGLNQLGYFTVSPERKPGAKTLIHIRTTLAKGEAKCVFAEPQFTPAVIKSVTRGTDVPVGVLDPVGSTIEVKSGSYLEFTRQIAASFTDCLL